METRAMTVGGVARLRSMKRNAPGCLSCLKSVTWPIGWLVLARREPQYQQGNRQDQNCSCHDEKIIPCPVFGAHNLYQDPAQRCNRDIDQVANRKFRRLEIDADHGPDFEIDKQKKNVRKFSPSLA